MHCAAAFCFLPNEQLQNHAFSVIIILPVFLLVFFRFLSDFFRLLAVLVIL